VKKLGRKRAAEVTGSGLTLTAVMNVKGMVIMPSILREEAGLKAPCRVRLVARAGQIVVTAAPDVLILNG